LQVSDATGQKAPADDQEVPGDMMNDTESESGEEISAGAALSVPMQEVCPFSKSFVFILSDFRRVVFSIYINFDIDRKRNFSFFEIRKVVFSFGVMPTPNEKTRFHKTEFSRNMKRCVFILFENIFSV